MINSPWKQFSERLGKVTLHLMKKFGKEPNIHSVNSIDNIYLSAFHHRLYSYGKVLLCLIVMVILDYILTGSLVIQIYGYLLNISGSLIIARGLFQGRRRLELTARDGRQFMMDGMLEDEFNGVKDEPLHDWDDLVMATFRTVDAIWGAFFLVIGFILQIIVAL